MNNNLMMFEGNDVEVFELNGHVLFNPKHVAKVLGIKNVNDNLRKMNKSQVVKVKNSDIDNTKLRRLNNAGENYLTEDGVLRLIDSCRNQGQELKKKLIHTLFPTKDIVVINDVDEIKFLDMLEETLLVFGIKGIRQYKVDEYRIDLYISKLNIAIEYDENNHQNYTYQAQELREQTIRNKLNCKFIRVNDFNSNSKNVGIVLKEILQDIHMANIILREEIDKEVA